MDKAILHQIALVLVSTYLHEHGTAAHYAITLTSSDFPEPYCSQLADEDVLIEIKFQDKAEAIDTGNAGGV